MALAARAFHDRGGVLPNAAPSNPLLSIEDGIGVVAIEGPILRKPDLFARVLMGATDSEEIGAAVREAGERDGSQVNAFSRFRASATDHATF